MRVIEKKSIDNITNRLPYYLLILYVFVLPYQLLIPHASFTISYAIAIIFALSKLLVSINERKLISFKPVGFLVFAIYMLVIEQFVHENYWLDSYYLTLCLNLIMFYLIKDEANNINYSKQTILVVFFVSMFLFVLLGLLFSFGDYSVSYRWTFMSRNMNELAFEILIAFSIALIYIAQYCNDRKWMLAIIVTLLSLVLLYAMVKTGTRFTMHAAQILLIMSLSLVVWRLKNIKTYSIHLAMVVFLLIAPYQIDEMFSRMADYAPNSRLSTEYMLLSESTGPKLNFGRRLPLSTDNILISEPTDSVLNLGGRLPAWQLSIKLISSNLLFGVGNAQYHEIAKIIGVVSPHNLIFQIGIASGLIGVILFLIVVSAFYKNIDGSDFFEKFIPVIYITIPLGIGAMLINVYHVKVFWFCLAYLATYMKRV